MTDVGELTLEVTRKAGRLAGSAEAAATLESMGIGDERAKSMGRANVFRLAADVTEEQERSTEAAVLGAVVEANLRDARMAGHRVPGRPAVVGVGTAVPIVASLAAGTLLTASLWNDGPAGIERATAVGLAAAASLPVVGGFALAMAAAGTGRSPRYGALRVAAGGVVAALVGGLGLWALLSGTRVVAPAEVGVALGYFALLSLLWLAGGLAAAAGRVGWLTTVLAAGTAVAVGLRVATDISMETAQLTGIAAAAVTALLVAWRPAHRQGAAAPNRPGRSAADSAPGTRNLARGFGPVVVLGAAFAAMVLVPQVATWYSQSPPHAWILAVAPDAQAGWGWALVAVLGGIAVVAASARGFGETVARIAERTPLTAPGRMATELAAARRGTIRRLLLAAAGGAAVTLVAVVVLMAVWSPIANVVSRHTAYVFAIVGPGLVVAAWSAFDCAILVGFRRPRAAALAAAIGLGVAAASSVVLASVAPGWTAAAGFVAGAVVCWALSAAGARRTLRAPEVALAGRG